MSVAPIRSPRLELVSMSPAVLDALLGHRGEAETMLDAAIPSGWPDAHDARFLRMRLAEVRRDPELQQWLVRALVLREPGRTVIGHAGFHGAPGRNGPGRDGALEVGYTVFEEYRGQGYATEAVVALMGWARARGISHFIASVAPDNEPSLAVVRKLGFVETGEQWDEEDGLELVFRLSG